MISFKQSLAALAAGIIAPMAAPAAAAGYPSHPVTIVVPYEPGSMVDSTVRLVAQQMSARLGQTFVVENRAGGNGLIAMHRLLGAEPDGYTLMADTPASAINPTVYKVDYDPRTDVTPVAQLMALPFVVGFSPSLPVKNFQEFVAYAKSRPGAINMASGGTSTRLAGELFGLRAGVKMTNVNYKGASSAIMAVLKDECQVTVFDIANMAPQISSGKMNGLVIATAKRSPAIPNVPTSGEVGLKHYSVSTWFGMFAPKGTPKAIVDELNANLREVFKTKEYQSYLQTRGATTTPLTADEFTKFFHSEITLWADVIRDANVKFE